MIFVDAGAFYAVFVRSDQNHSRAAAWLRGNSERLVTTSYVVAETLTLLRARRRFSQALEASRQFRSGSVAVVEWVTQADYEAAWDTFDRFRDKAWSFSDCISRVVMERMRIRIAFAFDEHFRQFGTIAVVP